MYKCIQTVRFIISQILISRVDNCLFIMSRNDSSSNLLPKSTHEAENLVKGGLCSLETCRDLPYIEELIDCVSKRVCSMLAVNVGNISHFIEKLVYLMLKDTSAHFLRLTKLQQLPLSPLHPQVTDNLELIK